MLAWDYYIIKESKNRFKDWTLEALESLRTRYKDLQDEKERDRIKKILDELIEEKRKRGEYQKNLDYLNKKH